MVIASLLVTLVEDGFLIKISRCTSVGGGGGGVDVDVDRSTTKTGCRYSCSPYIASILLFKTLPCVNDF